MTNENRPVTNDRKLREFCLPDRSGRENCATFAFPIYRDGKTARLLPSRYIGTGKLRDFCLPDISGRENCVSFGVPIYPRSKTVSEIVRRQCLRQFRRSCGWRITNSSKFKTYLMFASYDL